jgi:endonuclease YncB( thermonuclease family)
MERLSVTASPLALRRCAMIARKSVSNCVRGEPGQYRGCRSERSRQTTNVRTCVAAVTFGRNVDYGPILLKKSLDLRL